MQVVIAVLLSALLLALPAGKPDAFVFHGGLQIINGSGSIPLTRQFNQPAGTTTPADAFWLMGQPFKDGEAPAGTILTATLGGTPVKVRGCDIQHHADGSMAEAWLWTDYSGQTISPGGSKTLQLTSVPGSWSTTTTRTTADWAALNIQLQITNLTTTGTSAPDMDGAGTWVASLQPGTAVSVNALCTNDMGRVDQIVVNFVNTVTHRMLRSRAFIFVAEKADGSLGPIAVLGPDIEDMQTFVTGPASFTYDVAYIVNGVTIRSYVGVNSLWGTSQWIGKPDAQWEWVTGTDPNLMVTQDYTLVRATHKIPPLLTGMPTGNSYLGWYPANTAITGVNTTTGVFSTAAINGIVNPTYRPISTIEFFGTSPPGGTAFGTPYWACYPNSTTFKIYNGFTNALACGATGQIIPTTAGTSVSAQVDLAPDTWGQMSPDTSAPGERPEIGVDSEYAIGAYLIGNNAKWQRVGRVQAYVMMQAPSGWLDTNGTVLSQESPAKTSTTLPNWVGGTGLVSHINTFISPGAGAGEVSSDINGGVYAAGGIGTIWSLGDANAHYPDSTFIIWLLEHSPFLEMFEIMDIQRAELNELPPSGRNAVVSGVQYNGIVLGYATPGEARAGYWSFRTLAHAYFAAPEGSAEKATLANVVNDNIDSFNAYRLVKNPSYRVIMPLIQDDHLSADTLLLDPPYVSMFMSNFGAMSVADAMALIGDHFPSNLPTLAANQMALLVALQTQMCNYYSTSYNLVPGLSNVGTGAPGNQVPISADTFITTPSEIGLGSNARATFTAGSPNITYSDGISNDIVQMAPGFKVKFLNYDSDSVLLVTLASMPSGITAGVDYFIVSVTGKTSNSAVIQISTTLGGPPIAAPSSTTVTIGASLIVDPSAACPATGTLLQTTSNPDDYLQQQRAGLGYAAAEGLTTAFGTAEAAYTAASARSTVVLSSFSALVKWGIGDTW